MVGGAEGPAEADNVVEDCCPSAPIHKQISPAIGRNRELRIIKGLLEARTSIRPDRHCERRWRVKNGCDEDGEFRLRLCVFSFPAPTDCHSEAMAEETAPPRLEGFAKWMRSSPSLIIGIFVS